MTRRRSRRYVLVVVVVVLSCRVLTSAPCSASCRQAYLFGEPIPTGEPGFCAAMRHAHEQTCGHAVSEGSIVIKMKRRCVAVVYFKTCARAQVSNRVLPVFAGSVFGPQIRVAEATASVAPFSSPNPSKDPRMMNAYVKKEKGAAEGADGAGGDGGNGNGGKGDGGKGDGVDKKGKKKKAEQAADDPATKKLKESEKAKADEEKERKNLEKEKKEEQKRQHEQAKAADAAFAAWQAQRGGPASNNDFHLCRFRMPSQSRGAFCFSLLFPRTLVHRVRLVVMSLTRCLQRGTSSSSAARTTRRRPPTCAPSCSALPHASRSASTASFTKSKAVFARPRTGRATRFSSSRCVRRPVVVVVVVVALVVVVPPLCCCCSDAALRSPPHANLRFPPPPPPAPRTTKDTDINRRDAGTVPRLANYGVELNGTHHDKKHMWVPLGNLRSCAPGEYGRPLANASLGNSFSGNSKPAKNQGKPF